MLKNSWGGCLAYCVFYVLMHTAAIYYFMTAGDDPGFVEAVDHAVARLGTVNEMNALKSVDETVEHKSESESDGDEEDPNQKDKDDGVYKFDRM